jgi:hypothetical protein
MIFLVSDAIGQGTPWVELVRLRSSWVLEPDPMGDYKTIGILRNVKVLIRNQSQQAMVFRFRVFYVDGNSYTTHTAVLAPGGYESIEVLSEINDPNDVGYIGRILVEGWGPTGNVVDYYDLSNPEQHTMGFFEWGEDNYVEPGYTPPVQAPAVWNTTGTKVKVKMGIHFSKPQNCPEDPYDAVFYVVKNANNQVTEHGEYPNTYIDLNDSNWRILAIRPNYCGTWYELRYEIEFSASDLILMGGQLQSCFFQSPVLNEGYWAGKVHVNDLRMLTFCVAPFNPNNPLNQDF